MAEKHEKPSIFYYVCCYMFTVLWVEMCVVYYLILLLYFGFCCVGLYSHLTVVITFLGTLVSGTAILKMQCFCNLPVLVLIIVEKNLNYFNCIYL